MTHVVQGEVQSVKLAIHGFTVEVVITVIDADEDEVAVTIRSIDLHRIMRSVGITETEDVAEALSGKVIKLTYSSSNYVITAEEIEEVEA